MRLFWIRRGDLLGVLLGLAIAVLAIAVAVAPRYDVGNSGFGPEWNCSHPVLGYSEPICIKKAQ